MNKKEIIEKLFEYRKRRCSHPNGKFDKGKRWYPSEEEECSCCSRIRSPSRAWPYSLLKHCRTKTHILKLVEKHSEDYFQKEIKEGEEESERRRKYWKNIRDNNLQKERSA